MHAGLIFLGTFLAMMGAPYANTLETIAQRLRQKKTLLLENYRATYDVKLLGDNKKTFQGEMEILLECKGGKWLYRERAQGFFSFTNGAKVQPFSWHYNFDEATDGSSFSFDFCVRPYKQNKKSYKGEIFLSPAEEKIIRWSSPANKTQTLSADCCFPIALRWKIAQECPQAPTMTSAHLFDGRHVNWLASVSSFISPGQICQSRGRENPKTFFYWPVFQAWYQEKEEGENLAPTEQHYYALTENGVPLRYTQQVGPHKMRFTLKKLRPLSSP